MKTIAYIGQHPLSRGCTVQTIAAGCSGQGRPWRRSTSLTATPGCDTFLYPRESMRGNNIVRFPSPGVTHVSEQLLPMSPVYTL